MLLLLFVCAATLVVSHEQRTLLILEEVEMAQSTYSAFIQNLKARGHTLDIHTAADKSVEFQNYGTFTYQNVILLDPLAKVFAAFTFAQLHDFVEHGGNILLSSSTKLSKSQRTFAAECGVEYDIKDHLVMDHFNAVEEEDNVLHTKFYTSEYAQVSCLGKHELPVVFQGIGQSLAPSNVLTFSLLQAPKTAYVAHPMKTIKKRPENLGQEISLVSAVQARNNARLLFSGSLALLDNAHWSSSGGTAAFVQAISEWVFQERCVLAASQVHHSREDGSVPEKMLKQMSRPDMPLSQYPDAEVARDSLVYRIRDNLTYSFQVDEYKEGAWHPFAAQDVQLEFVMLDAYVRKNMQHDGKGTFSVTFQAPDAYGIFKFHVLYRRLGYSTIALDTQVTLRPFKHDEYERFILSAFPYYAASFSMMMGFFLMSYVFLATE